MKQPYRFIGDFAEILGVCKLTRFGQAISLTDEAVTLMVSESCPLLPEEKFEEIGFTDEELKKYPNAIQQHRAPADFQEKKAIAVQAFHDFKHSLLGGQ